MKVAILCRSYCQTTVDTIKYFHERGQLISLIVIETEFRKTFSTNEISFKKAHMDFFKYMNPRAARKKRTQKAIQHLIRLIMPRGIQRYLDRLLEKYSSVSVERKAQTEGIKVVKVERHSSQEARDALIASATDYALLTSSVWLIKEPLLSMEKPRIINAHCGKLPRHRSLDSLPWSVAQDDQTGLTTHFVDAGIDTGPILHFTEVSPQKGDTLISLRQRIDKITPEAFYRAVKGLQNNNLKPTSQQLSDGTHHRPMSFAELLKTEQHLQERFKRTTESTH